MTWFASVVWWFLGWAFLLTVASWAFGGALRSLNLAITFTVREFGLFTDFAQALRRIRHQRNHADRAD